MQIKNPCSEGYSPLYDYDVETASQAEQRISQDLTSENMRITLNSDNSSKLLNESTKESLPLPQQTSHGPAAEKPDVAPYPAVSSSFNHLNMEDQPPQLHPSTDAELEDQKPSSEDKKPSLSQKPTVWVCHVLVAIPAIVCVITLLYVWNPEDVHGRGPTFLGGMYLNWLTYAMAALILSLIEEPHARALFPFLVIFINTCIWTILTAEDPGPNGL